MFLCRIALGSVGIGRQGTSIIDMSNPDTLGLRRPPEKKHGVLHDSVGTTSMYAIFDNYQVYPEYLIHFT